MGSKNNLDTLVQTIAKSTHGPYGSSAPQTLLFGTVRESPVSPPQTPFKTYGVVEGFWQAMLSNKIIGCCSPLVYMYTKGEQQ
jgi:hypothetical protein